MKIENGRSDLCGGLTWCYNLISYIARRQMWRRFFSSHLLAIPNRHTHPRSHPRGIYMAENIIGLVIAIALAFLGFLEWRNMSREEKIGKITQLTKEAEQLYKTKQIGNRLQYVLDEIAEKYPWLQTPELRTMIESAVFDLNAAIPKIIDATLLAPPAAPATNDETPPNSYWGGAGRQN